MRSSLWAFALKLSFDSVISCQIMLYTADVMSVLAYKISIGQLERVFEFDQAGQVGKGEAGNQGLARRSVRHFQTFKT
jgi:hypothetical protein